MKKFVLVTSCLIVAISTLATAPKNPTKVKSKVQMTKAAGCSPASTFTEFAFNNVRTGIETGGTAWYDRGAGVAFYEVPRDNNSHVIFAGGLWMAGLDPANNLKLAAVLFRQDGNDYWAGPLTTDGAAEIDDVTCDLWDRHFYMNRRMAETHRLYFTLLALGEDPATQEIFADGYQIPDEILNWPAHGDESRNQSYYLAPFQDFVDPVTGEVVGTPGFYEPELGDYPDYDFEQEVDCRTRLVTDPVPLFGDETLFGISNDKGNIHTESQGEPIGMEIQYQAFAFQTNDEINNMTFYNYTLINRGTLTLTNTYFGQYADPDIGFSEDDFVGCDVGRGLGFAYNGSPNDQGQGGQTGYGTTIPAIGIDFFEGPYQDIDGINNEYGIGEGEALNGLGYANDPNALVPDQIVDNERYGMRRFVFFNRPDLAPNPFMADPDQPSDFYNYLRGLWGDGSSMTYGGIGYGGSQPADFMFPGSSDPLNWGTGGVPQPDWSEDTEGNPPGDRRFIQSAGPFTLDPGEFNNLTVGVVYGRAQTGGPVASLNILLTADSKAQSLFDNCFRLISGPDAPDLIAQELDQEIILYLSNENPLSNNQNEGYSEIDPVIPPERFEQEVDNGDTITVTIPNDRFYRFEGYQVYQLKDATVSSADLGDEELARLVFQSDIRNRDGQSREIGQLINYIQDDEIGLPVPTLMVDGANEGIRKSIRITTDAFATGSDNRLVNFRDYYFMAIAYAYNNYLDYNPDPNVLTGQPFVYLAGRQGSAGEISALRVVPHKPAPEFGGTISGAPYGTELQVTRVEGRGNGGRTLELSRESEDEIMAGFPWKIDRLKYEAGNGPISVKVIDPLSIRRGDFELRFTPAEDGSGNFDDNVDLAGWELIEVNSNQVIASLDTSILVGNEVLIPEYGISVTIEQYVYPEFDAGSGIEPLAEPQISTIEYAGEEWITGLPDVDGVNLTNWILAGISSEDCDVATYPAPCFVNQAAGIDPCIFNDTPGDPNQLYEDVLGGTWAPLAATLGYNCATAVGSTAMIAGGKAEPDPYTKPSSVDVVITPDKSKWTRACVLEMQSDPLLSQGGVEKGFLRGALSVDKNGLDQNDPGVNLDEATYFGQQVGDDGMSYGMGWFPGYAIDIETGERLNIAFGEDSYLSGDNGRDMLWNPTHRVRSNIGAVQLFGGQHYIYVFRNDANDAQNDTRVPSYDGAQFIYERINTATPSTVRRNIFRAVHWVSIPLLASEDFEYRDVRDGLVPSEVRVKLRVSQPYARYAAGTDELGDEAFPFIDLDENLESSLNNWFPMYEFSTDGLETIVQDMPTGIEALDIIRVVPNPYYASSRYETSKLDNRVKFTNLPEECTIRIYSINGDLIRTLRKDNVLTFFDWDLKNEQRIPISGGMYVCHIEAPELGEKIVKFFASMRPQDLDNL